MVWRKVIPSVPPGWLMTPALVLRKSSITSAISCRLRDIIAGKALANPITLQKQKKGHSYTARH